MSRIVNIVMTQIRNLSPSQFLALIISNLYQSIPLLIFRFDLARDSLGVLADVPGYAISKGCLNDLETMKGRLSQLPWEFQCHTFDRVNDFFVARGQGGIQHISWIYYAENHNRILALADDEAEIKFCLTLPDARGKGVYPKVINSILLYLKGKGINKVYMCVHEKNRSSIRGIEKAGFARIGTLRLRKILGMQVSKRYMTTEV